MLEVCVDSLESAKNAIYNGADELEICSCLSQGGLTPSAGLVRKIHFLVNEYVKESACGSRKKPKLNVMIRSRPGPDFCYSDSEMETMLEDIHILKELGADRIVFGCLTESREINDEACVKVLAEAHPLPVTFHRAFDLCIEPLIAIEELIDLGFTRVLTSGQRNSADDHEALELIKKLVQNYGDKIEVMPGAGVNVANVNKFMELGCKIVHSSCKSVVVLPCFDNGLSMGDSTVFVTDGAKVREIKIVIS